MKSRVGFQVAGADSSANRLSTNVIYGTSEPKTGALGARYDLSLFNPKKIKIISGIYEKESKVLLKDTFK